MKILIAGASGFIGKELTRSLCQSHQITVLGRDLQRLTKIFTPPVQSIAWNDLAKLDANQFDIIINLCGSNIGAKRWNATVKEELIKSRTVTNQQLIDWLIRQNATPRILCANAIGIYGAHDNEQPVFDETTSINSDASTDFLKRIGLAWQDSLQIASQHGMAVTTLRFGVVLKKGEGMLKKLELPFSLGLGSVLGTGKQILSWIHHQDLIDAINFLIAHPDITGPVNITSPLPVSQKEFATTYASVLKRPCFLTTPAFIVKIMFGEMGEYLLLKGQKVLPKRLTELQFHFTYPDLRSALEKEYS